MKRCLFVLLLHFSLSVVSKTTYIPTYRSYIHIVNGNDTVSVSNNLSELELSDANGMFTIRIDQEDVTKEKVKQIKRSKFAAGWMTFAAVLHSVNTMFSKNTLQYCLRRTNAILATEIAAMYVQDAKGSELLKIDVWVDNTTNQELMVNDMDRGLTWYILPNHSLQLSMNNPDLSRLRISDVNSNWVRYVNAIAGSRVKKWDIGLEDDECWMVCIFAPPKGVEATDVIGYRKVSKIDYSKREISIDEFLEYKKENKKKVKQ